MVIDFEAVNRQKLQSLHLRLPVPADLVTIAYEQVAGTAFEQVVRITSRQLVVEPAFTWAAAIALALVIAAALASAAVIAFASVAASWAAEPFESAVVASLETAVASSWVAVVASWVAAAASWAAMAAS